MNDETRAGSNSTTSRRIVDLVLRPQGHLHDFPLELRWEITRRHPYYLVFWSDALRYHRNELVENPAQRLLLYAASLMLRAIGVTGEPIDPASSFDQLLDGKEDPGFLTGSIQPVTFRALVNLLIHGLPPAERAVIGAFLMNAGDKEYSIVGDDPDGSRQKRMVIDRLAKIPSPILDSIPEMPLFYVHLAASQRSITRDVQEQAGRWKKRRKIAERRIHTGKIPKYLDVWDRREGWAGGGYAIGREQGFEEVARELKSRCSTVANQYRAAFELITGHPFSPELWIRLFGPLKYSELFGDPAEILSAPIRHRFKSPTPQPRTDTQVTPVANEGHRSSVVELASAVGGIQKAADLLLDLEEMIGNGASDADIATRLGIAGEVMGVLRARLADFRQG